MIGNRNQLAGFQTQLYRTAFHKVVRGLNILIFIMLLLIAGIIYFILFKPTTSYYGSTTSGQIIPMHPISR